MKSRTQLLILCQGAVCVALALVLNMFKIRVGAQGGSVDFVMIPLIIFAVFSAGPLWGIAAAAIYGTLEYFLMGGYALTWTSILLDYSIAFGAVGLAGIFKAKPAAYLLGALTACVARFIVHFFSGITIYAISAPETILGITTASPWLFSLIYNGFYMLFNTIAALILCPIIGAALSKIKLPINS